MAFTPIIVTGTWTDPDGSPAAGTVTFTLSGPMTNGANTVGGFVELARLDATGSIAQALLATDDSGTAPGFRQYWVQVDVVGATPYSGYITVPHAAPGGTVALDTLWVLPT